MVLKWTKRTPSVFERSLRQITKDIVPVTGAGTISTLCVSVIVTCAPDSYIVIAAHSSVTWS